MSHLRIISIGIVAAIAFYGCNVNKVGPETEQNVQDEGDIRQNENQDNQEDTVYAFFSDGAPSEMTQSDKAGVDAVNSFAFSIASLMEKQETGNYVFSPSSLGCLLGMLSEGANGESRSEICKALGFDPADQVEINEFFRNLIVLSAADSEGSEDLQIANVVVADKESIVFLDRFKKDIAGYYAGGFKNMDFSDRKAVADYVNAWASEHTGGRINKVIDYVNGYLCFVNALHFKGSWSYPFDSSITKDEIFNSADNSGRTVKMMHMTDEALGVIGYCDKGAYRMANMTYGNTKRYSFSVMLPADNVSIQDLLSGMNANNWNTALSGLRHAYIKLSLPSFNTDSDLGGDKLKFILKGLGIESIFDPARADFSNLCKGGDELVVNEIKHLANISLDEKGTEASAVSYADFDIISPAPDEIIPEFIEFNCNRPFLYAISDNLTGAILCMGCYR